MKIAYMYTGKTRSDVVNFVRTQPVNMSIATAELRGTTRDVSKTVQFWIFHFICIRLCGGRLELAHDMVRNACAPDTFITRDGNILRKEKRPTRRVPLIAVPQILVDTGGRRRPLRLRCWNNNTNTASDSEIAPPTLTPH